MLYVGVTNDIQRRVWQHRREKMDGFAPRYRVRRLVWFEAHSDIRVAIAREKAIKGWLRRRKIALIEATNPTWEDLAEEWFKNRKAKADPSLRSG